MTLFTLQAGSRALEQIKREGLRAEDISAVFGASGAAKWLAISGLDKFIFGNWLAQPGAPVLTFGTSVGAFKLAAAAQSDPVAALDRLADAYIEQRYPEGLTRAAIDRELHAIIDATIPASAYGEILTHSRFLFSCGATACEGLLGSEQGMQQSIGMLLTGLRELAPSKLGLQARLKRVVFCTAAARESLGDVQADLVTLDAASLKPAIIASGSLPLYMHGVRGLHASTLRDGGLLDYHPVPRTVLGHGDGLVLYPHFYPHLVERWFDKFYRWRRVPAERLDNVVLVSPSQAYCDSLALGRVPERGDFKRFEGRDAQRILLWREAVQRSEEMAGEFSEALASGNIAAHAKALGSS